MVLRNSIYNMLGLGLPLVVAVVAIPVLISGLGDEQFGILTLIWAIVGYFGLFDLGLGRAVTQQVAASVAMDDSSRVTGIVGTACLLMLCLGLFGGVVLFATAPVLTQQLLQSGDSTEVTRAFFWMALAMPAIVLTSGYRGILEAMSRFDLVNAIRFPMGIFTFGGPLVVVWMGYPRLDVIAAVLCAGRIVACAVHGYYALRSVPGLVGMGRVDRALLRPLLSMGGWLSVSNVVSPLMSYIDRFVLGFMASAAAVAYYATPQELILRLGIVPGAVAAALFPMFAARHAEGDRNRDGGDVRRYSLLILMIMLPMTFILLVAAEPLLAWWITPEFAEKSASILQVMSVAALASGLAQVPYTMLQGRGRADVTAKLHLIEFPLYIALLWLLVLNYGAIGAAWAWLIRIAGDMGALYYLNARLSGESFGQHRSPEPGSIDP